MMKSPKLAVKAAFFYPQKSRFTFSALRVIISIRRKLFLFDTFLRPPSERTSVTSNISGRANVEWPKVGS